MIKLYDRRKFIDVLKAITESMTKVFKYTPEGYVLEKIIYIGKHKEHEDHEFFTLAFNLEVAPNEWDKPVDQYVKYVITQISKKYKIKNTKLVEFIFEFAKDDKMYYYRGDGKNKIELQETDGNYKL